MNRSTAAKDLDPSGKPQKKVWGWGKWIPGQNGKTSPSDKKGRTSSSVGTATDNLEQSSVSSTSTPNSPSRKQKAQHPSTPRAQSPNHPSGKTPANDDSPKRSKFTVNSFFRRTGTSPNKTPINNDKGRVVDTHRVKLTRQSAWYEDDIRERQMQQQDNSASACLSDQDLRALELFDRQRQKALALDELEELVELADARRQAQQDEAELEILLERQERGDPDIDTSRMYLLELLTRQRRGEELEQEELEDLETLLEQRQDEEELQLLLTQKESGDEFDEGRLYELELLDRKRRGDPMTEDESRDVQLLELRRTDAKLDSQEFLELTRRKDDGEVFSSDLEERYKLLTLMDFRLRGEDLTEEEAQQLNDYYDARDEEHLDDIEMSNLVAKKERGDADNVDEERIYELELVDRQRRGEDLTDEEINDLECLQSRREQRELEALEMSELLEQKEDGNCVDEHRLEYLQLMDRKRRGQSLTDEELKIIDEEQAREFAEKEELDNLLKEKEQGKSVDENRLYELDLFSRKRSGEELTKDELMDLELFQMQRIEEREASQKKVDPRPKPVYDDGAKSVRTIDEISLTSSEIRGREQLKVQLAGQGPPITITFSPGKGDKHHISWISHGDESYVEDLLNQRENREDLRKEEALEEALDLYQVALKERNIIESEELFVAIFEEILKEKTESLREKDKLMDETLEKELALREIRKKNPPLDDSQDIENDNEDCHNERLTAVDEAGKVESCRLETDDKKLYGQDIPDCEGNDKPDPSATNRLVLTGSDSIATDSNNPQVENDKIPVEEMLLSDAALLVAKSFAKAKDTVAVNDMKGNKETIIIDQDEQHIENVSGQEYPSGVADEEETAVHSEPNVFHVENVSEDQNDTKIVPENPEAAHAHVVESSLREAHPDVDSDDAETMEGLPGESNHELDFAVIDATPETFRSNANTVENIEASQDSKEVFTPVTDQINNTSINELDLPDIGESNYLSPDKSRCESHGIEHEVEAVPSKSQHAAYIPMKCGPSTIAGDNWNAIKLEALVSLGPTGEGSDVNFVESTHSDVSPVHVAESSLEQEIIPELDELEVPVPQEQITMDDIKAVNTPMEEESLQNHVGGSAYIASPSSSPIICLRVATPKEMADGRSNITTEMLIKNSEGTISQYSPDKSRSTSPPPPSPQNNMLTAENVFDKQIQGQLDARSPVLATEAVELTDGELAEFNNLLDAQERGEPIDEDRLYELELVDRYSLGDELNEDEKADLLLILKERDQFQRYTKEYNELLDLQESGTKIDEVRLYCLELVVRKRLGESLTEDELLQLRDFEVLEQQLKSHAEADDPVPDGDSNIGESDEWQPLSVSVGLLNEDGFRIGSNEPLTLLEEVEEEELSNSEASRPVLPVDSSSLLAQDDNHEKTVSTRIIEENSTHGDEELDRLLKRQANGDVVDEKRIYELELLQRQRDGEILTPEEVGDLDFLQKSRKQFEAYSVEYKALLDRKEMDESYDSERLSNLELVIRSGMGESMTEDELDALEEFEAAEEIHCKDPIPSTVDVTDDYCDDSGAFNDGDDDDLDDDGNFLGFDNSMDHLSPNTKEDTDGERRRSLNGFVDPPDARIDEEPSKLSKENRVPEIVQQISNDFQASHVDNHSHSSLSPAKDHGPSSIPEQVLGTEICDSSSQEPLPSVDATLLVSDLGVGDDHEGVHSVEKSSSSDFEMTAAGDIPDKDDVGDLDQSSLGVDGVARADFVDKDDQDQGKATDGCSTDPPEAGDHSESIPARRDGSIGSNSSGKLNTGAKTTESSLAMSSEDVTLKTDTTSECGQASWDQSSFDTDRKDEVRGLTRLEQEEFEYLVEKQRKGLPVDEERLYELDLMERHGRNETLTPEELEDLDFIKESRRRFEQYNQEYISLRTKMEAGEEVDQDRLYILSLIKKRRDGEDLTEDEMCDIEDFEMEEEERSTGADALVGMQESHSLSHNESIIDVVGEARNQALDVLSSDDVTGLADQIISSLQTVPEADPLSDSSGITNTFVPCESMDAENELTSKTPLEGSDKQEAIDVRLGRVDSEVLLTICPDNDSDDLRAINVIIAEIQDTASDRAKVNETTPKILQEKNRWGRLSSFGSKKADDDRNVDCTPPQLAQDSDTDILQIDGADTTSIARFELLSVSESSPIESKGESTLSKENQHESLIKNESNAFSSDAAEPAENPRMSIHPESGKDKERDSIDGETNFRSSLDEAPVVASGSVSEIFHKLSLHEGTGYNENDDAEHDLHRNEDMSFDGHFSLTESEQLYEDSLFDRKDNGDFLSDEELFELELFARRRQGDLSPEETEELQILHERHREERNDELELEQMERRLLQGEPVDEERMYELELLIRFRRGEQLTPDETFELEAFDRLRTGEELSPEELEDLELLKEQRRNAKMDHEELLELKSRRDAGDVIDDDRLFELLVFDKHRSGFEMNEREVYAFELLQRLLNGDRLSDEEFSDLDHLKSRILDDDAYQKDSIFTGPLLEYVSDLKLRAEAGENVDESESCALELIRRVDVGESLTDSEMEALEFLHQEREESLELNALRHRKDNGLGYDEDLLHELELLDLDKRGQSLTADQWQELELFEKRRQGESLSEAEIEELAILKRKREERRLDEEDLQELRAQKMRGEEVDDDLFYELELFERSRTAQALNEDERFEIEMFELIRRGGKLSDKEVERLEFLKKERVESTRDEKDLLEMRAAQRCGDAIDEDHLYELELFHRSRAGETLTNEELYELDLFRRRRNGEELAEDDLDELALLKERRQHPTMGSYEDKKVIEMTEDEEDSVYRQDLLDRQMKGQRLDKQQFQWLEILQKRKRNEDLLEDELDELEIMRRQRKEKTEEVENTRKLLEKEMRKKQRREEWEQRKREKQERKEQRQIEKKRKPKPKKMRKKKKAESTLSDPSTMRIDAKTSDRNQDGPSAAIKLGSVEIIGVPPLEPSIPPKKEEPKKGLFGSVFGNGQKKKSKKELELEEMKRQQEALIKEQMKALALENELVELEKEKEIQGQLVKETIEKQANATECKSISSSSWETDTQYKPEESESDLDDDDDDDASSSLTSWDSLSSVEESVGVVNQVAHIVPEVVVEDTPHDTACVADKLTEKLLPEPTKAPTKALTTRAKRRELVMKVLLKISDAESHIKDGKSLENNFQDKKSSPQQFKAPPSPTTSPPRIAGENKHRIGELNIKPVTMPSAPNAKKDVSGTLSPKLKTKALTLSAHLRKQQKKRQRNAKRTKGKYGDDLSLGTSQLAKTNKLSQKIESKTSEIRREAHRPWMINIPEETRDDKKAVPAFTSRDITAKAPPSPSSVKEEKIDEKFIAEVFGQSVFNFNQSFSKIPITDENDVSQRSVSSDISRHGASKEDDAGSMNLAETNADVDEGDENESADESLGSSINTLEMEAYVFKTPDYDQIESRLAEKLRNRAAEFDSTWDNVVADQNVVAQINQRLRERQRARDHGKEQKKDEKENEIDNFPRLFLFEGEKISKKKRRKLRRKKKDRKIQKKLDRTLSKEFKRAMKEVFDSDSEGEYKLKFGDSDNDNDDGTRASSSKRSLRMMRRLSIENSVYDDEDENSGRGEDEVSIASDPSNDFDGGYLQRLQQRSLQPEMKRITSDNKIHMGQSTHSEDSTDDDDLSLGSDVSHPQLLEEKKKSSRREKAHRSRRKLRRNRNGELVGEGVDPADIYSTELERVKEKKVFKISELRKEMEDLAKQAAASTNKGSAGMNPELMMSGMDGQMPLITPNKAKANKLNKKAKDKFGGIKSPGIGITQSSFDVAASEQGLFGFGTMGQNGVGMHHDDDVEEEEAFLTGGNDSGDFTKNSGSKLSGLGSKLRLSSLNFFSGGGGDPQTPSKSRRMPPFGNGRLGGAFSGKPSSSNEHTGIDDDLPMPATGNSLDPMKFHEPLPVPESQDTNSGRGSRTGGGGGGMMKMMGKGKAIFSHLKLPGKRSGGSSSGGGFMIDDDDQPDEGGMGLLG